MMNLTEWRDLIRKQDPSIVPVSLKRVADRGGPNTQWNVDPAAGRATFRLHDVSWYPADDGTIVPNGYDWGIGDVESEEDCRVYEDAIYWIHEGLA